MNNIETILRDLYNIDPSLKEHEPALKELIIKLIEARPGVVVDQNFVNNLRGQLLTQASQIEAYKSRTSLAWDPRWGYGFGALAIAVIALVSLFYVNVPANFESSIKSVSDSGFGPLAAQSPEELSRSYRPQSGGGGLGAGFAGDAVAPSASMIMKEGSGGFGGGSAGSDIRIAPYPYEVTKIVYEYMGDAFTQDEDTVGVYRRVADESVARAMAKSVSKMGLGLIDLSKLKDIALTDVNLLEQRERGYSVSLNLREGWISIFQNWEKWPQAAPCYDEASCQKQSFIEESQIPADADIVAVADAFLNEYKINRSNYGQGMISKSWGSSFIQFPLSAETGVQLVPFDAVVIYPLLIDNKEVYEEWGGQTGITVSINMKGERVSSVSGVGIQNYERSNYKAETDVNKILELAKKGGQSEVAYDYAIGSPTKIVTVKLGTPIKQLVQIYQYKEASGRAEILYVPAMVFPIQDISDKQYFFRENVIIPLASELFSQRADPPVHILPAPMPMPAEKVL